MTWNLCLNNVTIHRESFQSHKLTCENWKKKSCIATLKTNIDSHWRNLLDSWFIFTIKTYDLKTDFRFFVHSFCFVLLSTGFFLKLYGNCIWENALYAIGMLKFIIDNSNALKTEKIVMGLIHFNRGGNHSLNYCWTSFELL